MSDSLQERFDNMAIDDPSLIEATTGTVEEVGDINEILEPKRVEVLNLGPNDILVISSDQRISDSTAERIEALFREKLQIPMSNKIAVIGEGLKLGVIRKTA